MIAKAEWFSRRKYTGWGLSPKSWQGGVYVMAIAAVIAFVQNIVTDESLKLILSGLFATFIVIDILQAMASIKLDEREQKIEAMAERNASWTMVAGTVFSILFITTIGRDLKGVGVMPVLIFPILIGTVAKGLTNYILEKRGV